MNDNYLRIDDFLTLNFCDPNTIKIKDDFDHKSGVFDDAQGLTASFNGLKARIAATHSGIITKNNMFYLPDQMKNGAHTFTDDYPKPVLKFHDRKGEPIGRVVEANYIDTSGNIKDNVKLYKDTELKDADGNVIQIDDQFITDFCTGRMPFGTQVDIVRDFFLKPLKDGVSLVEKDAYIGLGHIQIVCDIPDEDAIQKFLDGRYITGSVGARTNRAVCSICKQNWTKDGECEHTPGKTYDHKICILIAGSFIYDEYSVANNPADRQSKVLELYYNGEKREIGIQNQYDGGVKEVKVAFPQYEKLFDRENLMKDKKTEEANIQDTDKSGEQNIQDTDKTPKKVEAEVEVVKDETIEDFFKRLKDEESLKVEDSERLYEAMWDSVPAPEVEVDVVEFEDAKLKTKTRKKMKSGTFCGPDRSYPVPDRAHAINALARAKQHATGSLYSKIKSCVCHKYPGLPACEGKTAKDEVQDWTPELTQELKEKGTLIFGFEPVENAPETTNDAMLTKDQRNALSKSVFCGSCGSFPVPDKMHAIVTLKFLEDYEGPGDKEKILSCVQRKIKAKGWDIDDASVTDGLEHARILHMITSVLEENIYAVKYGGDEKEPPLTKEDVGGLSGILKKLAGLVGKDNLSETLSADKQLRDSFKKAQDIALLGEIVELEDKVGDLNDEIKKIKDARSALREEYELLQQDVSAIRDDFVKEKVNKKNVLIDYANLLSALKSPGIEDSSKVDYSTFSDDALVEEVNKLSQDIDMKKITDKLGDGTARNPEGNAEDPTLTDENLDKDEVIKELRDIYTQANELSKKDSVGAKLYLDIKLEKMKEEGKLSIKE